MFNEYTRGCITVPIDTSIAPFCFKNVDCEEKAALIRDVCKRCGLRSECLGDWKNG